ncbi:hypothetical protein [Microbacterium esteraromaticum]|uniref:hypothetical protein n=1 Tax=Microbacterium esteraromaticum TaxID=57043 RepID=UPI0019D354CE|nr:hypothetical protein [Microbacterium esteraromaticum]MBN7792514.1 hypothetical protein [Microbacterium esteraromaticum]
MNRPEVAQLLTLASLVDNRSVTDEVCLMWHRLVGHVDYDVAAEALQAHFAGSTEYLLPAHITAYARAARQAALPSTMSPAAPDACERGAHRRLPDGTCLYCTDREATDA